MCHAHHANVLAEECRQARNECSTCPVRCGAVVSLEMQIQERRNCSSTLRVLLPIFFTLRLHAAANNYCCHASRRALPTGVVDFEYAPSITQQALYQLRHLLAGFSRVMTQPVRRSSNSRASSLVGSRGARSLTGQAGSGRVGSGRAGSEAFQILHTSDRSDPIFWI